VMRKVFAERDRDAVASLIAKMGPLPPVADLPASELLQAMTRDKKVIAGTLHFVLPASIGSTQVATDISTVELTEALGKIGIRGG
jgi:3-dehydroquinate synthetase